MTLSSLITDIAAKFSGTNDPTADQVDIPRYMGDWYVIANIPTIFEKNAYNAVESYSWNEKDQRVDIDFHFNQGSADGEVKHIPQKGFIDNKDTNAQWKVQPWWPLKFTYLIHELAEDYSDVIVGVPDRSHVWIMSRTPVMNAKRFTELRQNVARMGYDISKLQKVPQSSPVHH